ncbi:MAG TPA: tripartite tricarboxylate transporter substrate binding protein [Xanthobacteraceae bacterium]|jgi:tripartite-type tricarboxylate transporter receptor subunit TctC|nr:tripartite tricarboxylate transporter substrate binding protein [Xanthobacteraceae bacterium]HSJ40149.1 tripartite tricarboxylate transporter substrate binding protein [Xanthobacteraceae bacterium]
MKTIVSVTAGCAALMLAAASHAQNAPGGTAPSYPTRQVRVIVPYPAGGPTDVMARLVAQHLSESLGQNFFVENLTGASGVVGTGTAANSPGDGHTILFVTNDFAVAPTVSSKVPYDALKSFAPVSIAAASPQVVVVHPSFPAKNMQELIAVAKASPGKYNYAALGIGFGQLSSERLFRLGLGLDVVRVPFPGAAPIITSTLAGHTPIAFLGLPPAAPHIKEGTLRALAVTSAKRSPVFPNVPTMDESGVRDQQSELIIGVLVPAATPKPIVDLLQRQIARIVALPDVKERLDALGFAPVASTPEAYATQIKADIETWSKVVREANIKVE